MADDDRNDRDNRDDRDGERPSDAEEEKVRETEEEGGEERVEADFTSNDRESVPFYPDKEGVAPPTGTPKPA